MAETRMKVDAETRAELKRRAEERVDAKLLLLLEDNEHLLALLDAAQLRYTLCDAELPIDFLPQAEPTQRIAAYAQQTQRQLAEAQEKLDKRFQQLSDMGTRALLAEQRLTTAQEETELAGAVADGYYRICDAIATTLHGPAPEGTRHDLAHLAEEVAAAQAERERWEQDYWSSYHTCERLAAAAKDRDEVDARKSQLLVEAEADRNALRTALQECRQLFDENHALDHFDWGKSYLKARDIRELNELPGKIDDVLRRIEGPEKTSAPDTKPKQEADSASA